MKHKHAEVIKAWADGAEIEVGYSDGTWCRTLSPIWSESTKFRIYDKFRELKEALMKGHSVEFEDIAHSGKWYTINNPNHAFSEFYTYRIYDKFRELKEAHKNGAAIQWKNTETKWRDTVCPNWLDKYEYRIKPTPRKIDWSKMPKDTLCKVNIHGKRYFSGTVTEEGEPLFIQGGCNSFSDQYLCFVENTDIKLIENDLAVWFGGECPVPEGVRVEVKFRSDVKVCGQRVQTGPYFGKLWEANGRGDDIIAYRILGVAEG